MRLKPEAQENFPVVTRGVGDYVTPQQAYLSSRYLRQSLFIGDRDNITREAGLAIISDGGGSLISVNKRKLRLQVSFTKFNRSFAVIGTNARALPAPPSPVPT